ncbi:MAG: hypothetical protein KUG68_10060, partial [Flavobacteriaceae bacterium]|nr:hypothetical protein [Flavobacteriaceae bacterium]
FHGKLWVNIGNDGYTNALIETDEGELIGFKLADNSNSISTNFVFVNERGTFEVNLDDFDNVVISNISIDETNGDSFVMKERDGNKRMITLGTYDNSIAGFTTGTWDITVPGAGGVENIESVIVTSSGGGMNIELEADLEGTTPGCYTGGPYAPFFWTDNTDNRYELYATGQTINLTATTTVIYDFGFGKAVCDNNSLPYTQGLFHPEATADILFGGLAPGCYNINDRGYYVWLEADGVTVISAGRISFTLPDFGALGYLPFCTNGIMDGTETGIDCGGTCAPCLTDDNANTRNVDSQYDQVELAIPSSLK